MTVSRCQHEDLDPYSHYKAIKLITQSNLRSMVVVERRDQPEKRFVMTVVPIPKKGIPTGVREVVENLLDLSHPNIARVFESYEWNEYLHVITEDWTTDLNRMYTFRSLTECMVADVILQLTSVVRYMHEQGFVHGNMDISEVLIRRLDDGGDTDKIRLDIKIIDFCLDRHVNHEKYVAKIQERKYGNPPEAKEGKFTGQGDMWTVGAICFKLLTGDLSSINLHDRGDFNQSNLMRCSDQAQSFVNALLRLEPEKRLTPDEALQHDWFKGDASNDILISDDVVARLEQEEHESEFKRLACSIIANHENPDNVAAFRKLFEDIDTDHSGYLTYEQFTKGLKSKFTEEKLDALFLRTDLDENGKIDYIEFLGATMNFKRDIEEVKLKEAFHYMDVDGDGTIDVADLVKLLSIPEEQAKDLLHEACSNDIKNPRMTQKQFVSLFRMKWLSWFTFSSSKYEE